MRWLTEVEARILIAIERDDYAQDLGRRTEVSWGHISTILNKFKGFGWITIENKGRRNSINLTDRGEKVKKYTVKLARVLK